MCLRGQNGLLSTENVASTSNRMNSAAEKIPVIAQPVAKKVRKPREVVVEVYVGENEKARIRDFDREYATAKKK